MFEYKLYIHRTFVRSGFLQISWISTTFARVARVKGHPSPYQCQQGHSHAKNDGQKPRSGHLQTWTKISNKNPTWTRWWF